MPDGVRLAADLYGPVPDGTYSTVLFRTPYGKGAPGVQGVVTASSYRLMAERGYNVLVQDVRGRGDSEGVFEAFANEDADGRKPGSRVECNGEDPRQGYRLRFLRGPGHGELFRPSGLWSASLRGWWRGVLPGRLGRRLRGTRTRRGCVR